MELYIALSADRTGRYAHVWGSAPTWSQFHDQLEDSGCEVIEDQTVETGRYAHVWGNAPTWSQFHEQLEDSGCKVIEDQTVEWDGCDQDEIAEDCLSIHQLLNDTTFIAH